MKNNELPVSYYAFVFLHFATYYYQNIKIFLFIHNTLIYL